MAGIMDLMKVGQMLLASLHFVLVGKCWICIFFRLNSLQNMYEEGDDDMKRTIAKAWTDARNGKTADPLKNLP